MLRIISTHIMLADFFTGGEDCANADNIFFSLLRNFEVSSLFLSILFLLRKFLGRIIALAVVLPLFLLL